MHELKPLSPEAIPGALAKAERYRLLNESDLAESICEDILGAEHDSQPALVTLLLAITDQFRDHGVGAHVARARAVLPRLHDEYERLYYDGIICERCARAHLAHGGPSGDALAASWFGKALDLFARSIAIRPAGNDEAVLRWNACARTLDRHPELHPRSEEPPATIAAEW
jgi:hypothetical protein